MGVKDLYQLFESKDVSLSWFQGKTIAVDALYKIHSSVLAQRNLNVLSHNTLYLQAILNFVVRLKEMDCDQYWIFDNPESSQHKRAEHARRRERREKAQAKVDAGDEGAARAAFSITSEHISNVQSMLGYLGVPWCVAPKDIEAEQLGARLTMHSADAVYTGDADAFLFGAQAVIRPMGKGKHQLYSLNENLVRMGLGYGDLVKVGVILGTDFAEKTFRVGIKTVLSKFRNIKLSPEQEKAVDIFRAYFEEPEFMETKNDYLKLIKWLRTHNFSMDNLFKIIQRVDPELVQALSESMDELDLDASSDTDDAELASVPGDAVRDNLNEGVCGGELQ
jgi:flap endonuclease-1